MGVDVDAEVMIGVEFDSFKEAQDYVVKKLIFRNGPEGYEDPDNYCLDELANELGLEYKDFTAYVDRGGVLGESVSLNDLRNRDKVIDEIWKRVESELEDIKDKVDAHIWARYW